MTDGGGNGDAGSARPPHGPGPEVRLDAGLVRDLLAAQHPDLADRPLVEVAAGWDNTTFRLGDDLAVRLPRRALAAPLIAHEQRWLPELAAHLPVPIPAPVRNGRPHGAYPWAWSVVPWLPGTTLLSIGVGGASDDVRLAHDLGRFLAALHQPAPPDAPPNPYRGMPIVDREPALAQGLAALGDAVDGPRVRATWERLAAAAPWPGPAVWLHGDLHAANVLVDATGHLAAVIDFGDLTSGDPATDLSIAWIGLSPAGREELRRTVGADDATWDRARAWAISLAVAYASSPLSTPSFLALGPHVLAEALADP